MATDGTKGFEFDFDDWADLYKRDPAAFEARRQAVLAIELAKGGPRAQPARDALRRLESRLEGQSDEDRIRQSMAWMIASMRQLGERVDELRAAIGPVHDGADRCAAPSADRSAGPAR